MKQRYDLRKNGNAGFEIKDVMLCPYLKRAYEKEHVSSGIPNSDYVSLEVEASSEDEAFELFLGEFIGSDADLSAFSVMPENRW